MALARYYLPDLMQGDFELSSEEARHVSGAKRQRVGDNFEVFDGKGNVSKVVIVELKGRKVIIEPVGDICNYSRVKPDITIAVAVPKGKRLQYMVEKLTELGVRSIVPVVFERSVAGGDDPVKKYTRWAIEACKQSRNPWIPEFSSPVNFEDFIAGCGGNTLMADYTGGSLIEILGEDSLCSESCCCLIGPEGGFSEDEFTRVGAAGVKKVNLAPNILRIETAAVAFASAIMALMGIK